VNTTKGKSVATAAFPASEHDKAMSFSLSQGSMAEVGRAIRVLAQN
jgi:hypothetical protein